MIIDIATPEDPGHRSLEVDGYVHSGSPATRTSPAEPSFYEITSVDWSNEDPLDGQGDAEVFADDHLEEIQEECLREEIARYEGYWG